MSRPLEIFEENICVIDNNEPIKIRKISIEKIPIAFEIIKNQKENPAVIARDLNLNHSGARFELSGPSNFEHGLLEISVPGKHAVLNALAAIAVGAELGVDDTIIRRFPFTVIISVTLDDVTVTFCLRDRRCYR